MGEIFRYAWRGSGSKWQTASVGFLGALVAYASGVQLNVGDIFLGRGLGFALCATIGVAVLFAVRLCWAPFHFAFTPHGGVRAELKKRLGANMGPILLMAAGIVLFVLCFGVGAVWFAWPKSAAHSSLLFTVTDAQALAQLHVRHAATEYDSLAKKLEEGSKAVADAYCSGLDPYNHVAKGQLGLLLGIRAKLQEMVRRDFAETLFEPRNSNSGGMSYVPNEEKVLADHKTEYRKFYHAWNAGRRPADQYNGRYKRMVYDLDRIVRVGSTPAPPLESVGRGVGTFKY